MTVIINTKPYKGHLDPRTLHLLDPSCGAFHVKGSIVTFKVPLQVRRTWLGCLINPRRAYEDQVCTQVNLSQRLIANMQSSVDFVSRVLEFGQTILAFGHMKYK